MRDSDRLCRASEVAKQVGRSNHVFLIDKHEPVPGQNSSEFVESGSRTHVSQFSLDYVSYGIRVLYSFLDELIH